MSQTINIGAIQADLQLNSGHLERGLAAARQAMQAMEREMQQIKDEYDKGSISVTDYDNRLKALDSSWGQLSASMRAAYGHTTNIHTGMEVVEASAGKMTKGFGRAGMAMMQFGYIVDDIQYGFQGIVNNIAPLTYGLTGNAGIATAAQIAAVAVYQLYTKWDLVKEAFGDTSRVDEMGKSIEGLKNRVKELADELEKGVWFKTTPNAGAALEYAENQIKVRTKAEKSANAMEGHETDAQKEERESIEDAIGEGGYDQIKKDLADKLIQDRGTAHFLDNDTQRAKLKSAPDNSPMAQALQDEARRNALKTAETMLGGAANDRGTRKAVEDQLRQIGHAKTADVLSGVESPEELKKYDEEAADFERKNQQHRESKERKKRKTGVETEAYDQEAHDFQIEIDKPKNARERRKRKEAVEVEKFDQENLEFQTKMDARREAVGRRDEHRKKRIDDARNKTEGLQAKADQALLVYRVKASMGRTKGIKSPGDTIRKEIEKANPNLKPEEAQALTEETMKKAKKRLGEKIQNRIMSEPEKVTKSETFAASELANRVQGGVSNENHGKKHTSQFDQMIGLLTRIQKNKFFFNET